MTYLYMFIFIAAVSIAFIPLAFVIDVLLLKLPIKQMKIGFVEMTSFELKGIPLTIGWIPIGSSVAFTEKFMAEISGGRQFLLKLLHIGITLATYVAWLLIGQIDGQTFQDCFAVTFFQLPIDQFIALHGPLDIWKAGALMVTILWVATFASLLLTHKENKIAEVWNLFIFLSGSAGMLTLLGHLCYIVWGL